MLPTIAASATYLATLAYSYSTNVHWAPRAHPRQINRKFQRPLPNTLYATNHRTGIRSIPAGTEMRLPTPGRSRTIRTASQPCRPNQLLALSRPDSLTNTYQPNRLTNRRRLSSPSQRPNAYRISALAIDPAVEATST